MPTRRKFIRNSMVAGAALSAGIPAFASGADAFSAGLFPFDSHKTLAKAATWPSRRPAPGQRKFRSKAVEETIKEIEAFLGSDSELAWLFSNCFPNTLDTTVSFSEKEGRPDTFVITGDIHAMWLRDSSAQVWPYVSLPGRTCSLRI